MGNGGHSLESDFTSLVKLGCLAFQTKPGKAVYRNRYQKVETLPAIFSEAATHGSVATAAEFIQTDLSEFVDSLAQPLQSVQRFSCMWNTWSPIACLIG